MAYQVLARKYRPQRFSDVAGQEHVTRTLGHALEQERVAHGYIFSGHRGIGKTTIARILAMALNCRNKIGSAQRPTPEPCGVCDSCTEIRAGNSLDVIEIDAATNRGIDEIRELREAARYAPARDRYKIYLLDEAHQITDAAFNALLKILEEPPEHVVFMMATTQPEDIPQTIRSRCQHFSFHAVTFDDIVTQLTQIATQEGILADPQAIALLAEAGDGSMRDALSIMDQAIASAPMVDGKAKLDGNEIRELMGTVPDAVFERILEAIGEGQSAAVMEELNRLLNAGNSPSQMARQLVRYLRNCLMAKLGGEKTQLLQISGDERARAVRTATLFSEEDLTRFLQVMLRTFDELNYRQEPRLHLELGLMKLVHLQRLIPLEQILSGLPGAGRPPAALGAGKSAGSQRPAMTAPPTPVQAPRPLPVEPAKPPAPSPFELDRQRKLSSSDAEEMVRMPAAPPVAVPEVKIEPQVKVEPEAKVEVEVEPEPSQAQAAPGDLDQPARRGHRCAQRAGPQHRGLAAGSRALETGRGRRDPGGGRGQENHAGPDHEWRGVEDCARGAARGRRHAEDDRGAGCEATEPASASPRVWSRDSIEAVALGNPLVRQAQELFHAEVRSVLDLRENQGNDSRSKG